MRPEERFWGARIDVKLINCILKTAISKVKRFSRIKFGKFDVDVALKVFDPSKMSSSSFEVKSFTSKPYMRVETIWITNHNWPAKLSTSSELALWKERAAHHCKNCVLAL